MNEIKNSVSPGLKKSFRTTIIILIVMLLIMTAFFAVVLTMLIGSFNGENVGVNRSSLSGTLRIIRACVLAAGPVITVLSGISLYRSYKLKEALMRETEPMECVVKDLLITSCYDRRKRRYFITPILEDVKTGELYCSPRRYDMSFYSTTYSFIGNSLTINIRRSDGSVVELGDTARVYIKEIVTPIVSVNGDQYTIDNKCHRFSNKNPNCGIEMISRLNFFRGIVDVERY